jgi:hypothetical protein
MTITVLNNQSLLDIAIQTTGKSENFLQIAMENNLVPTEPIAPGTILTIPAAIEKDDAIVKYYKANNIVPATALTEELLIIEIEDLNCEEKLYECFKDE